MSIGAPLGMLVALHNLAGWKGTLVLIATIIVSDSAQYYTGRAFGRRPLAPAISPKKTVEGAIGGVVFATLANVAVGPYVFPSPLWVLARAGDVASLPGSVGVCF